jgi:hypothetical protein
MRIRPEWPLTCVYTRFPPFVEFAQSNYEFLKSGTTRNAADLCSARELRGGTPTCSQLGCAEGKGKGLRCDLEAAARGRDGWYAPTCSAALRSTLLAPCLVRAPQGHGAGLPPRQPGQGARSVDGWQGERSALWPWGAGEELAGSVDGWQGQRPALCP